MSDDSIFGPRGSIRPLMPSTSELNPASWAYERIAKSIVEFESKLNDEQEIGARLVSFSANETIRIDDIGYWGPDIIKFYGRDSNDNPVELIQHMSQINVLLVALPKETAEPKRIGFALEKKLEQEGDAE